MIQAPPIQTPKCQTAPPQANYNAVKIDINNPSVNAPGYTQNPIQPPAAPITAPMYSYPEAKVYEVPQQSIYEPKKSSNEPKAVKEVPAVPQPVIVKPTEKKEPVSPASAPAPAAAVVAPAASAAAPVKSVDPTAPVSAVAPVAVTAKTVDVKAPEVASPKVDINAFIGKLTNPNYDVQANAMETIADMVQNKPQEATELLDTKIVDSLLGIMTKDTSKLAGPTPQQLQIREKIMSGKQVSEAETAEANKITPMEQAERNKQYSIYTVAIMQKLYGSEIEKMSNTVVPMTELPGAAGVVEQVKNNPNPMVRASGIDALSYIQRPEYKQDLTTIFTVAKGDKDTNVQQAATKALDKLAQVAKPAEKASAPVATSAPAAKAPAEQPKPVATKA